VGKGDEESTLPAAGTDAAVNAMDVVKKVVQQTSSGFTRGTHQRVLKVLEGGGAKEARNTALHVHAPGDEHAHDHAAGDVALAPPPAEGEAGQPIGFAIVTAEATTTTVAVATRTSTRTDEIRKAKIMGFTGDACSECGSMKMVRNGTCTKCNDCGATSGCS